MRHKPILRVDRRPIKINSAKPTIFVFLAAAAPGEGVAR
jgi:hypothetical protein